MKKELLVAVAYTHDKSCKEIYKVVNVDEQEFKKLVNQKNEYKDKELKLESEKQKAFIDLKHRVDSREYLIAKSLYDNYVDRGFIEDNIEFQQMFYNHIFHNAEFDLTLCPSEFLTILEFVRGA